LKNHDGTRICALACSHIELPYPLIGCIFSLVIFISGHEHIQAHMHTLNQPVQMQENIKTLFIPGYVSLKMFVFQKLRIDNVSSTVEKQATSQVKSVG